MPQGHPAGSSASAVEDSSAGSGSWGQHDMTVMRRRGGAATGQQGAQVFVNGWAHFAESLLGTEGPIYLGHHTTQVDADEQSGSWGAVGLWLSLQTP